MANSEQRDAQPGDEITLHSRYIRDFSFENLITPPQLPGDAAPLFDVDIGVDSRRREQMHEVVLSVRVTARREERIWFLIELCYAGLFQIQRLVGEPLQRFVYSEAPRLLFPFVDRICADVTRDGGLPPLMLTPPDFRALCEQRLQQGAGQG